tara:strand:+ start:1851 stop:2042 length:192 start_codon:yes stop_codon:yes gene_type:complete
MSGAAGLVLGWILLLVGVILFGFVFGVIAAIAVFCLMMGVLLIACDYIKVVADLGKTEKFQEK